jgi:hypothetical protein
MTWAELRAKVDQLCTDHGLDPSTVEVRMEPPEPSAPVLGAGMSTSWDGKVSLFITGFDYFEDFDGGEG